MGKLTAFNFLTLNGFYKGPGGDLSWHRHGGPEEGHAEDALSKKQNSLLFGRTTYQMMSSYWPTSMAAEQSPIVAKGMNEADKFVCSNTLKKADWNNTRILSGDIVAEVKKLKAEREDDLTILGSGSLVTLFAEHGLIDAYQFMLDPVAIGEGTPVFKGLGNKLDLKLINVKQFKSGVLVLDYEPM
jgi:dihydrofolate reductase